jgi:Lon-like ATP-dependent protease
VSWYSEVFNILFAELDRDAAKKLWQKQLAGTPKKEPREEDD